MFWCWVEPGHGAVVDQRDRLRSNPAHHETKWEKRAFTTGSVDNLVIYQIPLVPLTKCGDRAILGWRRLGARGSEFKEVLALGDVQMQVGNSAILRVSPSSDVEAVGAPVVSPSQGPGWWDLLLSVSFSGHQED